MRSWVLKNNKTNKFFNKDYCDDDELNMAMLFNSYDSARFAEQEAYECTAGYDIVEIEVTIVSKLHESKILKSRKDYTCVKCRRKIKRGEKYERVIGKWCGC